MKAQNQKAFEHISNEIVDDLKFGIVSTYKNIAYLQSLRPFVNGPMHISKPVIISNK